MPAEPQAPLDDVDVPAFWQALGLPGLVDVHTHFMPERVLAKVWDYFDAAGPLLGRRWPIQYRQPEAERLAHLRGLGVRRFTAMLYPHKPDMAEWLNEWAAEFAARTPDVVHTATFFAEPGAAEYVAAAVAAGAHIFKAHVQVGGYDPRDATLDGVWGTLAAEGIPVVVHCGSGPVAGRHTGLVTFAEVLRRHPTLTAVVAHMGMPEYSEFLDLAERFDNVRLDTTMAFTDFVEVTMPFPAGLRPRLVELADRIVLGTDFPNIPYDYAHQLQALVRLDLGDDWLRQVCWHNGVALIGDPLATR